MRRKAATCQVAAFAISAVGRGLAPAANQTSNRSTHEGCCGNLFSKLEFGGQWPLTMRARYSAFRYCPNPLDVVTAKQLDKLEFGELCHVQYLILPENRSSVKSNTAKLLSSIYRLLYSKYKSFLE